MRPHTVAVLAAHATRLQGAPRTVGSARVDSVSIKRCQASLDRARNAIHAVASTGVVTLSSRCTAQGIDVQLSDTGDGMTEQSMKNVFTPDVTTQPVGAGTALRLSIVFCVIEEHSGRVDVHSRAGASSTFTVRLQLGQQQAA
ncbi:MAG: HAMP domain-containing sensor histidine kinase [Pseudomonadota bacterium]